MGLITRCPACGTMFKVVADQLRISEGWVRCGHCAEIFDATADLRDESELELPESHLAEPPPPPPRPLPVPAPHEEEPAVASEYPSSVHSEVPAGEVEPAFDAMDIEEQVQALHQHPLDEPFELRRADLGDIDAIGPHGFSKPMPLEPEPDLHDLSFVRQARRREFWTRAPVRIALCFALLALALLLAAQVAWQDRDRLAAANPSLRPALAQMCSALGCKIGPPRAIESVGIESSSFNKIRGDTYRLSVTLRNQAPMPVAMPALELTLTDSADQPVLRRVLQPSDFAPGSPAINASADWSASVAVAVNAAAAGGRISGYRVFAFYP